MWYRTECHSRSEVATPMMSTHHKQWATNEDVEITLGFWLPPE